ncbi:MAG: type II toxin-antitoxin system VapC family toxin [Fimbriimonadaceae bacterium]|nr:type II toxin-antitoxin system VapC family toxin [Fimbriimonadaceae bacterium]
MSPEPPEMLRVYADTSVFGGCFDPEFQKASNAFIAQVRAGRFRLVVSPIVEDELRAAPPPVRQLFADLAGYAETADVLPAAQELAQRYLDRGIVGDRWWPDALHVACAVVAGCSILLSWNFRHIVHCDKIHLYNAVNQQAGYSDLAIHSPPEVIDHEEAL